MMVMMMQSPLLLDVVTAACSTLLCCSVFCSFALASPDVDAARAVAGQIARARERAPGPGCVKRGTPSSSRALERRTPGAARDARRRGLALLSTAVHVLYKVVQLCTAVFRNQSDVEISGTYKTLLLRAMQHDTFVRSTIQL